MDSGVTQTFATDKRVLVASFDTLGGAKLAVEKLEQMEKSGLLDVANAVTVSKNAEGKLDVKQAGDVSTGQGAKVGAIVGGVLGLLFPPSLLATTALGAALGGITAKLRSDHGDADNIKAMAESLEPGASMLVAVVEPQWADELEEALSPDAVRISWANIDQEAIKKLEE
jgi:uncharacterized membrane protein